MAMTPLPSPPSRQDPDTFVARGDALLGALPAFVTEANELQLDVEAAAAIAEAAAAVKNTDQYKGVYSAGTTYTVGQSVKYGGSYWLANKTNLGITPTEGADWANTASNSLPITVESGNVTFASAPTSGSPHVALAMGSQYELVLIGGSASTHAVVWDKTNKTFGAPVLVRSASWSVSGYGKVIAISSTQAVLVTAPGTTALEAVCLTLSGTTITVGTAATATLASNLSNLADIQLVGSSIVVGYLRASLGAALRALSISGSTVTIGAESALTGNVGGGLLHTVNASVVLTLSSSGTLLYAKPYSVSGSTLTAGTEASTAVTLGSIYHTGVLSTGRWFAIYTNTTLFGSVISVSGTTATISAVSLMAAGTPYAWPMSSGGRAMVVVGSGNVNVLTDTAGTASAGTAIAIAHSVNGGRFDGAGITIPASGVVYRYSVSGANPVVAIVGRTPTGSSVTPPTPDVKCTGFTNGVQSATYSMGASASSSVFVALCTATGATTVAVPSGMSTAYYGSHTTNAAVAWAADAATATTYNLARLEIA